jgi:hypothetical protein
MLRAGVIRVGDVAEAIVTSLATILARSRGIARALGVRARWASLEQTLRSLTPEEGAVFAAFLDRDSRTAAFVVTGDGAGVAAAAHRLAARGYLYEVGRRANSSSTEVCYGIEESVFAFFRRRPQLLERAGAGRRPS